MRYCVLVLLFLALALPGATVEFRSGDTTTIAADQTIDDDLIVSGGTVQVRGRVTGDVVAAGGTIDIGGPVGGNLIVAGGTVNVDAPIAGTVYAASGTLNLDSTVGRNAVVAGGTVNVGDGATVGRDLAVSGGTVNLSGSVMRDVLVSSGTLNLTNDARVGGDLRGQVGDADIAPGAVIVGARALDRPRDDRPGVAGGLLAWLLWRLLMGLGLLVVALVLAAAMPRLVMQTTGMLITHPWASLLTGFLTLVLTPIAIVILMLLLIGIPLALILLALYLIALYIAPIFVAVLLGQWLLRRGSSLVLAALAGVAIYVLVTLIPVLGGIVGFLAMLFGLGALVLTLFGRTTHPIYPLTTYEGRRGREAGAEPAVREERMEAHEVKPERREEPPPDAA
jgi:cytoskeletal protein CcmA (bactofilin family)